MLANGYSVHHALPEDIPGIADLITAYEAVDFPDAAPTLPVDVLADWEDLHPATDAWVVQGPDGLLCGYGRVLAEGNGYLEADNYVHPHHWGHGIGTALVLATEARAQEIAATIPSAAASSVVLINHTMAHNVDACALLEAQGYQRTRIFWRMRIEMTTAPQAPAWPTSVIIRACRGEDDIHRAYVVSEEAFADHWGHIPTSFADWTQAHVRERYDPALWFLAWAGDQLVGVALCRMQTDGRGWIRTVAVARDWRGRGLATALLHQAFGAFWLRGVTSVGLGVDSESLTGAQRLYERAGMRAVTSIARYEKTIRSVADLGVQTMCE